MVYLVMGMIINKWLFRPVVHGTGRNDKKGKKKKNKTKKKKVKKKKKRRY